MRSKFAYFRLALLLDSCFTMPSNLSRALVRVLASCPNLEACRQGIRIEAHTCRETQTFVCHRGHVCLRNGGSGVFVVEHHHPRHLVIIDGCLQGVAGRLDGLRLGEDCFSKFS